MDVSQAKFHSMAWKRDYLANLPYRERCVERVQVQIKKDRASNDWAIDGGIDGPQYLVQNVFDDLDHLFSWEIRHYYDHFEFTVTV